MTALSRNPKGGGRRTRSVSIRRPRAEPPRLTARAIIELQSISDYETTPATWVCQPKRRWLKHFRPSRQGLYFEEKKLAVDDTGKNKKAHHC
jgi:hypothetical protein